MARKAVVYDDSRLPIGRDTRAEGEILAGGENILLLLCLGMRYAAILKGNYLALVAITSSIFSPPRPYASRFPTAANPPDVGRSDDAASRSNPAAFGTLATKKRIR